MQLDAHLLYSQIPCSNLYTEYSKHFCYPYEALHAIDYVRWSLLISTATDNAIENVIHYTNVTQYKLPQA